MFSKWELIEEDVPMIRTTYYSVNLILSKEKIRVDVYRKKKWNGIYKYKNVERG
jgi:hypothetical protein